MTSGGEPSWVAPSSTRPTVNIVNQSVALGAALSFGAGVYAICGVTGTNDSYNTQQCLYQFFTDSQGTVGGTPLQYISWVYLSGGIGARSSFTLFIPAGYNSIKFTGTPTTSVTITQTISI